MRLAQNFPVPANHLFFLLMAKDLRALTGPESHVLEIFKALSMTMDTITENRTIAASAGGQRLRIAVISSFSRSLTNFRLELLKRLREKGHEVTAYGPENDPQVNETLAKIGVTFVQIPMRRTGTNPFPDIATLFALLRSFRKRRPDVVLPYTMKPIIYGGIAARLTGVPRTYALVTGLGHVFANPSPRGKEALVRQISVWLYRMALKHARRVFVYNDADHEDVRRYALVRDHSRIVSIPGSGVDLAHFRAAPVPAGPPVFILIARLLRDKGVYEFAEAARQLRKRHPEIRWQLLGQLEPHQSGVRPGELRDWAAEGILDYLGEVRDVRPHLAQCSVFVLPSYYREGIPRSILEAMATGRAIITTDLPGCRDTVVAGENGFIVPPRDANALARAMERFALEPQLARRMGERSRQLATQRFDVHTVNSLLLREAELV